MNNKIIIILLIVSIGLNIGIITMFLINNTYPFSNTHCNNQEHNLRFNKKQYSIINQMKHEIMDSNRENMENIHYNRNLLMELIKQDKIDTVRIDSIINRIVQLQGQIEKNTVLKMCELKQHISKEQFNNLLEIMKQRGINNRKTILNRRIK